MVFIAGLTSLTETDCVFLPGEPVKSSLDERTAYAKGVHGTVPTGSIPTGIVPTGTVPTSATLGIIHRESKK